MRDFGIARIDEGDRRVGWRAAGAGHRPRAVHFGVRVLILDKPTAALGVKQAIHVLRIANEAERRGLAVIFITRRVRHAMAVCDHFAVPIRSAIAAVFRRGGKTRAQITDLIAGGETVADLEASVETCLDAPEGRPAAA